LACFEAASGPIDTTFVAAQLTAVPISRLQFLTQDGSSWARKAGRSSAADHGVSMTQSPIKLWTPRLTDIQGNSQLPQHSAFTTLGA
jgi:hypothetical protein